MCEAFKPTKLMVFHFKGRALIEFADEASVLGAIDHLNASSGLGRDGGRLMADRSHTGPIRPDQGVSVGEGGTLVPAEHARASSGKIVKLCIKGCVYPITAASIYGAVAPFGAPVKIATFKSFDEAVNALVELDSTAEAAAVVRELDGQFLFTGRIGLMKVSLAYQEEVIIKDPSSDRSWDRSTAQGPPGNRVTAQGPPGSRLTASSGVIVSDGGVIMTPSSSRIAAVQTCVAVHGVDMERTKLVHIFNLFGYFGNVARAKINPARGLVLVDYATTEEAANALCFIRPELVLFGCSLQCSFAKYPTLMVPPGITSDTMCDYTTMPRIHRYAQGIASERVRWIIAPSPRLHVILSGRPSSDLDVMLRPLFEICGRIVGFQSDKGMEGRGHNRMAMTLVEFENAAQATDCLAKFHNHELPDGQLVLSFTNKRLN